MKLDGGVVRWSAIAALGAGLGMAGVAWTALTGPFPLGELCTRYRPTWVFGLFERPRYTALTGEAFVLALGGLSALYLLAIWLARRGRSRVAALLLVGLVPLALVGVLLPGYPLLSNDVFKYVMTGRILAVYGENPFLHVPAEFPNDRFHDLVYWKAQTNAHGPVWRLLEGASALLGGERCATAILAMKVWPTLAYLGTCGALFAILRARQPGRALPGTLLYAWSPLVLLETVQNGHNDVVAALSALVAAWLATTGRWRWALPLLAVAVLVKPTAAALGPFLLVAVIGEGRAAWRPAAQGIALAAGLVVAAYVPFWEGPGTLAGLDRGDIFSASPAALVMKGFEAAGWPLDRAMDLTGALASGLFALAYLLVLFAVRQGQLSLVGGVAVAYLAYLLVAAQWFNPWYLLWPMPFAALAPEPRVRIVALVFSLLAPLTYPLQYDPGPVVLLVFVPTLVLAAYWRRSLGLVLPLSVGRAAGARSLVPRHG